MFQNVKILYGENGNIYPFDFVSFLHFIEIKLTYNMV